MIKKTMKPFPSIVACLTLLVVGASTKAVGAPHWPSIESNTDRARAVLREGLNANDPDERIQAIQASGLVGLDGALQAQLEKSLQDDNVNVRVAAINTLSDLKSTESIPALRERLTKDKTPEVTFAAARALYAMHDQSGIQSTPY
jgi:HEAT repeat protein